MYYKEQFEAFIDSPDFEEVMIDNTKLRHAEGMFALELFPDYYQLSWNDPPMNWRDSEGIVLPLPWLEDNEWDHETEKIIAISKVRKKWKKKFKDVWEKSVPHLPY